MIDMVKKESSSISDGKFGKIEKSRDKMKHRLLSNESTECSSDKSSTILNTVVKDILVDITGRSKSTLSRFSTLTTSEETDTWRGWIILSETNPIAVLTSENVWRKEKKKGDLTPHSEAGDELISKLARLVSTVTGSSVVIEMSNVKAKAKKYDLSDLKSYDTTFQKLSQLSLFKDDAGFRRHNKEDTADLSEKHNLPEIFKEEGSQASSTKLRVFKAKVTHNKKGPVCSLNERSREKLFLMFTPSDENVQNVINNSQIKNKIIRHEIGKYLKPQKSYVETTSLQSKQLYTKRWIPPLKPITDAGNLKNLPPLNIELIYDLFFKDKTIERDGYSILIKEQPLLVENITLFIIPEEAKLMTIQPGFEPRYSFEARKGEKVPADLIPTPPKAPKQSGKVPKMNTVNTIPENDKASENVLSENPIIKTLMENKLCEKPELLGDVDVYLKDVENLLRKSVGSDLGKGQDNDTEQSRVKISKKNRITKRDKFVAKGDKAESLKNTITIAYGNIENELDAMNLPDYSTVNHSTDTKGTVSQILSTQETVMSENTFTTKDDDIYLDKSKATLLSTPTISTLVKEDSNERPHVIEIMNDVRQNRLRLKKDPVVPVVKPILETKKSDGKKRVYLTDMQQYWSEYHTDTKVFYHEPEDKFDHFCGTPVILDNRIDAPFVYKYKDDSEIQVDFEEETSNISFPIEIEPKKQEASIKRSSNVDPIQHIVTVDEVDEAKHSLAYAAFSYKRDKKDLIGYVPSTYYKNSKKEIAALNFVDRFLRLYEKNNQRRRKLFLCVENEYGIQKLAPTTIKPTGLPYMQLDDWQKVSKFVANNVNFTPLYDPLYLPHVLYSPGVVLARGWGNAFELSTLLASLLIGQGYDAYVVSGYANVLLTSVEPSRNYLRYDCPYLLSDSPTDPFQDFSTTSHIAKVIENEKKPAKEILTYHPSVPPYFGSSYLRQAAIEKELEYEEMVLKQSEEDETRACKRHLDLFDADDLEGKRVHSWVLILPGKRGVEEPFFIEPSTGFSYSIEDQYYYGVESLWNHSNYWINRSFISHEEKTRLEEIQANAIVKNKETSLHGIQRYEQEMKLKVEEGIKEREAEEEVKEEVIEETEETSPERENLLSIFSTQPFTDKETEEEVPKVMFALSSVKKWIPLLMNSTQMLKLTDAKKSPKKDLKAKIANLQKCLDMPNSWCGRISISSNQVERRINEPFKLSLYKRAECIEYQVGLNEDGLVAKVTKFLDLNRTDPDFELQMFERRKDLMYRRRRDIVSDKLTEYFAFGREDCLKTHEFIDGADYMYCDHNLYFYWDFREDGLKSIQMTDLYLKLEYGGRKDHMESIIVLYGSNIDVGRKKRKGADESGKTPRKEIQTIVMEFSPSQDKEPWNDFSKITIRVPKNQIMIDYHCESQRVTVTSKFIKKSHNDPDLGATMAEIAKKKLNRNDDDDALSELDVEYYDKELDKEIILIDSSEEEASVVPKENLRKGKRKSLASKRSSEHDAESGGLSSTSRQSSRSLGTTRSSVSAFSFALSDDTDCFSAEEEKELASFYPAKLAADNDKSLWACSQENQTFMGRKIPKMFFQRLRRRKSEEKTRASKNVNSFDHFLKESPPDSSEEGEVLKETKKRQIKAIGETQELFKAIEKQDSTVASIADNSKYKKIQLCKIEHVLDLVNSVQNNSKSLQKVKSKLDKTLHKKSVTFPNEKVESIEEDYTINMQNLCQIESLEKISDCSILDTNNLVDRKKQSKKTANFKMLEPHCKINSIDTVFEQKKPIKLSLKMKRNKKSIENDKARFIIDPLIINVYENTDRCLEDPVAMKRKRSFIKTEAKMKSIYSAVKRENEDNGSSGDDESGTLSVSFKNKDNPTISEEEEANEKDVDSIDNGEYNSDDNYSLKSQNALSQDCIDSDDSENESDEEKAVFSCHSENESVIEYQTEATHHEPYDFKGYHFNAGKMYARKMFQVKQTCDDFAVDSDQQSSYDGEDLYEAEFLEAEIDKFLDNTIDKIYQDVKEAKTFILRGGTNEETSGVYYCNLNDKYIHYVDSYFKKINIKREMKGDKAVYKEMLKQRAKEPDKIINHIKEYIACKKKGIVMNLDENLMKLIPHVRPTTVKKKDRLGYEILTEDSDEEEPLDDLTNQYSNNILNITQDGKRGTTDSMERENITTAELIKKIDDGHKASCLLDAVNNFKKFKDMETVNQLIDLPLHETFSDVNIRNHLQNAKVNDGYYIDDTVDGRVRKKDACETDLGFVTDPDYILLSKDIDSPVSSSSESEVNEQENKPRHMEIVTPCGKEKIKEGDFFEPVYLPNDKTKDPFRIKKFRMFAPLDPKILDSDSDGSIHKIIQKKRRKAFAKKDIKDDISIPSDGGPKVSMVSMISTTSALQDYKRLDVDRTFGLEPLGYNITEAHCRVAIKNMSSDDDVSNVDKAILLEYFLSIEDETINYVRKIESYINNLLNIRKEERKSTKRNILRMSRKGIRRGNFKVLKQKLIDYEKLLDDASFTWDLLEPYIHLLLPEDHIKKYSFQTAEYIIRCLTIDFVERELYKLKELFNTYEEARKDVIEKKNLYLSELEHLSIIDKRSYEAKVIEYNEKLRRVSDKAHVLRFVILRRAKQSSKKFKSLVNEIKNDQRINEAYNKARERLILLNLSKRWPEHFEFIKVFSGLPVASEPNDFSSSYVSPIDDLILKKVIKKVRRKPAKYQFTEDTFQRFYDLMEEDRDYYEGIKKQIDVKEFKTKLSSYSIFTDVQAGQKNESLAAFINKMEIVNDLDWTSFLFNMESDEEEEEGDETMNNDTKSSIYSNLGDRRRHSVNPYEMCTRSLLEELIIIRGIESWSKISKDSLFPNTAISGKSVMTGLNNTFESVQKEKDYQFLSKYGTEDVGKEIRDKLPKYFTYI